MKWASEIVTWCILGALIVWAAGGKERFDCAVMHFDDACSSVAASYSPSLKEEGN